MTKSVFLKRHAVFLSAFCALYFIFLHPLLLGRGGFVVGDYKLQFYPWSWAYADALKKGFFLLWTPLIQSGFPLFAEGQMAMLYPPNILFFKFLPFTGAYNLVFLAHFAVAGIGAYRFGLKIGMSREGATLTALCFTFGSAAGGNFYGWLGFRGLALFPWTLCLAEDFISRSKDLRPIFWLALLSGFAWLTGPQMAFYQTLFLGAYYLLKSDFFSRKGNWPGRLRNDVWFLSALFLALVIAAPQLWATMELASHSTRTSQDTGFVLWGSMAPWSLSVLFFYCWNGFLRCSLYIGILPLFLIASEPLLKKNWKLWVLAVVSLFLAFGRLGPFKWFLLHFPVFSLLRNPSKFLFFTAFFLCVIAGFAFDGCVEKYAKTGSFRLFRKRATLLTGLVIFLVLGAWLAVHAGGTYLESFGRWYTERFVIGKSFHARSSSDYLVMVPALVAHLKQEISFSKLSFWLPLGTLAVSGAVLFFCFTKKIRPLFFSWILLALLCADLYVYGKFAKGISWENIGRFEKAGDETRFSDGKLLNIGPSRFLKLQPNENMVLEIANPGVYAPLLDKDYYYLTRDFGALNDSFGPSELKMEAFVEKRGVLDFMGVKYILAGRDQKKFLSGFRMDAENGGEMLYVNDGALPEFTFEPLSNAMIKPVMSKTALKVEVEITSKIPGTLNRNQVFDQGWKVYVDDKAARLKRVRGAFQGVQVGSGKHRVRFLFEPAYWVWGRWVSLAGYLLVLAGLFFSWRRKSKC